MHFSATKTSSSSFYVEDEKYTDTGSCLAGWLALVDITI